MIIKIKWLICDVIHDWLITEGNTVFTFRQLSVATTRRKSFKEIEG